MRLFVSLLLLAGFVPASCQVSAAIATSDLASQPAAAGSSLKHFGSVDDGVYGDFSGIVFDHCKYEFKALKRGQKFSTILAGPTCDSFDTISLSEDLPELDVARSSPSPLNFQ